MARIERTHPARPPRRRRRRRRSRRLPSQRRGETRDRTAAARERRENYDVTSAGDCTRDKNREESNARSALSRAVLLALQEVLQGIFNKLIRPPSFY